MKKYTNFAVIREVPEDEIISDEGAEVKVYISGTLDLAPIFSDNGITPITQPLLTNTVLQNNPGQFNFYSAGGLFDIVIHEGTPDETRLTNQSISTEVSVKDFGIIGDGVTDYTTEILSMIASAASLFSPIIFTPGTYIFNPSTTVDLSGIPSISGDGVIIDITNAAATTVFKSEGTRSTALASAISINAGDDITATIATTDLDVNDVLVITSIEALPNTERAEYFKSGQFTVYTNDGAGAISVQPPIPYDFTASAYLYKMTLQKLVLSSGITFLGKTASSQVCFELFSTNADIYSTFIGFNGDVVRYVTSKGRFEATVRSSTGSSGSGVDIDDASDVIVNADISGAFHAVDCGGGTSYWDASYAGGSSGTNMALSCRATVSGGFYSASSDYTGAVNAHGNTDKFVVGDCTISGGALNASARVNVFSNIIIEGTNDILLRWGADNDSKDWCDVGINNVRVKRYGTLPGNFGTVTFQGDARARDIEIDGLYIETDYVGTNEVETPLIFLGQCRSLKARNITPINLKKSRAMYTRLFANTVYEFENIRADDDTRIEFDAQEADVNLKLKGLNVRDVTATSGIILKVESGMNYNEVDVIDCVSVNTIDDGLNATNVKKLRIKGGDFSANNASGGRGIKALLTENLTMNAVDLSGTVRAFDITDYGSGSTVSVVGCDVSGTSGSIDGSLGSGCTWAARSGNHGDNKDYFRQDDGNLYYYDQSGSAWVAV